MRHILRIVLAMLIVLGAVLGAWAQGAPEGRAYGTLSEAIYAVPGASFTPDIVVDGTHMGTNSVTLSRHCNSFGCVMNAPVHLPAGAVVTGIELDACLGTRVKITLLQTSTNSEAKAVG